MSTKTECNGGHKIRSIRMSEKKIISLKEKSIYNAAKTETYIQWDDFDMTKRIRDFRLIEFIHD